MKQTSCFAFQQKIQFWTISPSVTSQRSTMPHWNLQPRIIFSRRWNWESFCFFSRKRLNFLFVSVGNHSFFFFMWFMMKWRDDDVISDWGTNSFQRWRSHSFQFFPKRQSRRWREKRHMCVRARRLSLVFQRLLVSRCAGTLVSCLIQSRRSLYTADGGEKNKINETATRETPSCSSQT